ncbi:unnamed protein product [Rotaria magnacalcarata]|uniref:Uncharacterized protein n=2 Tax=Rotaria magnacalcarata TaxID=392030 RepID=A0A814UE01_9BILA|nr:unnamed protein product [Rotaria magnacalcarata]
MLFSYRHSILYFFTSFIITVFGQETCKDYSPDPANCTKFIRCFHNLRIKFTCPPDTAWEDSLKTCVWKEYVEACNVKNLANQRNLDDSEMETYEADPHALDDIPVGRTLAEARALGPLVTPKQYACTLCNVGACGGTATTVQCYCGNNQCPPTAPNQQQNLCSQNPCLNGGQCMPNGQGFICRCPPRFTGNRCEAPAVTPCQPSPCQNGGICIPQGASFMCQCPSAFYGRCCEIQVATTTRVNPCASVPCRSGGQCIPSGASYFCQCPMGYYGSQCEMQNYCMPNPCANNGVCQPTTTGYICRCTYPFTGTNCQQMITTTPLATRAPCGPACACMVVPCPVYIVINPCMPSPCQNMGSCGVQNNGAKCYCSSSYTGYYCQHLRTGRSLISNACNKTCLNGGQCFLDGNSAGEARCSCPSEYYGPTCEFMNRPKSCSPKNPCMNNAQCITTKSSSKCVCKNGTSGILCEKIKRSNDRQYCPLNCQAGGTCVYVKTKSKCRCPKGRSGRLCELSSGKSLSTNADDIDMLE